jgi:phytanoyl-CoA hydroxylase
VLSSAQISQFGREGYTIVPDFFDQREVHALQQEVDKLKREGRFRNVATKGDGETATLASEGVNLQMVPMDNHSELFRAIAFCDKVVLSVTELVGEPAYKILDQSFYKPSRVGLPTNWHQDNAYFRITDPLKGTAMWIAIDDATGENGTLKIVPGAFHHQLKHDRDPESDHHIRTEVDESTAVHCDLKAGGVVFFCYGTPHATGANTSESDRTGVGIHFLHGDYFREDQSPYYKKASVAVSGPDACGGMNKYGADYRGRWAGLVAAQPY